MRHREFRGQRFDCLAKSRLEQEDLRLLELQLVLIVGPIAKLLVRAAQADAQSVRELYRRLAEHVHEAAERDAFLAQLDDDGLVR